LTSLIDSRGILRLQYLRVRFDVEEFRSDLVNRGQAALRNFLVDWVARLPARVQTKLLAAFLTIVGLLIVLGAVGLQVLSGVNEQTDELIKLQRKIAAYRQVQHDMTNQLFASNALLLNYDQLHGAVMTELSQFDYDLNRMESVAGGETELLAQVRQDFDRFTTVVTRVVELIRADRVAEARNLQLAESAPLADRLEQRTNQLVSIAEADMEAAIQATKRAYRTSRSTVIAFAVGSIFLALGLGYLISSALIGPVKEIETRLRQIAGGDFARRVEVVNRDELGVLAANVNQTSEELGRLYREIEEKRHQLEIASHHKSQFLANMSHELRTPLNSVLGFTEMLADGLYGELPEKAKTALARVQANGKHLLGLINDVLDLSKIEAGQVALTLDDFSIGQIVRTVMAATEPLARAKGLSLSAAVTESLPLGRGDERRLTQVLLNLVGNAVKFTDTGSVAISAEARSGRFEISVRDTGPGIPPEYQNRIFEEFQQVDDSSTQRKGGTGLGLAISKRIVEMHGGTIGVDSVVGSGSTFRFSIPIRPEERVKAA
jgi:signal transduction histidine kinase